MARPDRLSGAGGQRTGVTRRAALPRPSRSNARRDWMAFIGVGALAVVVLALLAAMIGPGPTGPLVSLTPTPTNVAIVDSPGPSTSPTAGATATITPPPSPLATPATPMPTPTLSPSPIPTPSPTPTPTSTPTPTPTPTPSPSPTPTPAPIGTIGPPIPASGLLIVEPADGSVSSANVVIVRGLAAPGSVITRVIPMWFDDHVTTDSVGRWSFVVGLNAGENVLTFRVADDDSTAQTLRLYYFPS